jgi:predicted transcriptional regulator
MNKKEIMDKCNLNEEELRKFNQLTKNMNHKEDHRRAYRTMMNQTRRKLLKFIGENTRTIQQIKSEFHEEQDQINYHLSMLEQLFYVMYTESGWKLTPRGIGFLYNTIMDD